MTAASIRRATLDDVPAIDRIEHASFGDPWNAESFAQMIAHPRVHATVAEVSGAVAGYCVAWVIADEAELANLAVDPEVRRAGIGGALLDDLLRALDAEGGARVYLEVRDRNLAAQALYRSRGFVASGRRKGYYRKPDEDAVVMRRDPAIEDEG